MKSNIILLSIALTFSSVVQAGPDDFKKEIQVGSDRQFGSIKDKVMTFVDNVKVEQGSLLIEADKLEVIASAGERQRGVYRFRPTSHLFTAARWRKANQSQCE